MNVKTLPLLILPLLVSPVAGCEWVNDRDEWFEDGAIYERYEDTEDEVCPVYKRMQGSCY